MLSGSADTLITAWRLIGEAPQQQLARHHEEAASQVTDSVELRLNSAARAVRCFHRTARAVPGAGASVPPG